MNNRCAVRLTGSGGQGVILISVILAEAAVLDGKKIKGTTAVTVISKDRKRVWNCESFNADAHFDGVLIMPDDADLQAEIAQLKIEGEEMRACMASFTKSLDELKEKYEKLTEGYDFT